MKRYFINSILLLSLIYICQNVSFSQSNEYSAKTGLKYIFNNETLPNKDFKIIKIFNCCMNWANGLGIEWDYYFSDGKTACKFTISSDLNGLFKKLYTYPMDTDLINPKLEPFDTNFTDSDSLIKIAKVCNFSGFFPYKDSPPFDVERYLDKLIWGVKIQDTASMAQTLYYIDAKTGICSSVLTDVHENKTDEIYIYPNPINDYFSLILPENINDELIIKMINIHGDCVLKSIIHSNENKSSRIKTDKLPSGLYFIVIQSGTMISSKLKVIKL
ncbi:MAG: T9SS type A sorting domain-containing protein [Candidatus Kapabacteria bacterium]|nr:T9SS type A sorting domain-containing protein [Candidatus Kapabacteria bacterium]